MARADFAYAQARILARHGARAGAADWHAVESSRGTVAYLALARSGPLARWVVALDEGDPPTRIESRLLEAWRRQVDEVACWLPPAWRAAVRWFGTLVELPLGSDADAAQHVPVAAARHDARPAEPIRHSADPVRWLAVWRDRMPRAERDARLARQVAALLMPRLADPEGERDAAAVGARTGLVRLMRRAAGTPAAVFAFLALEALDLERLRGGLVARRLLADTTGRHAEPD